MLVDNAVAQNSPFQMMIYRSRQAQPAERTMPTPLRCRRGYEYCFQGRLCAVEGNTADELLALYGISDLISEMTERALKCRSHNVKNCTRLFFLLNFDRQLMEYDP